jgi:hypothetical protein
MLDSEICLNVFGVSYSVIGINRGELLIFGYAWRPG